MHEMQVYVVCLNVQELFVFSLCSGRSILEAEDLMPGSICSRSEMYRALCLWEGPRPMLTWKVQPGGDEVAVLGQLVQDGETSLT